MVRSGEQGHLFIVKGGDEEGHTTVGVGVRGVRWGEGIQGGVER